MNKLAVFLKSPSARSFTIKTLAKNRLSYDTAMGVPLKDLNRNQLLEQIHFLKKRKDPTLMLESPEQRIKRLSK